MEMTSKASLRSFGRRQGRKLSPSKQQKLEIGLENFGLPQDLDHTTPQDIFPDQYKSYVLEIGFGNGGFIYSQAQKNPETAYIGAEVFMNGVAHLCADLVDGPLNNIRLYVNDARDLLAALQPASLDQILLLFPDPWPKKKHKKRRILNAETLRQFADLIKPGGQFICASDNADYVNMALELVLHSSDFSWTPTGSDDWTMPPTGWSSTKYELKDNNHRDRPTYLTFQRTRCE